MEMGNEDAKPGGLVLVASLGIVSCGALRLDSPVAANDNSVAAERRTEYERRAADAEKNAAETPNPHVAEQWRLIAGTWRTMADALSDFLVRTHPEIEHPDRFRDLSACGYQIAPTDRFRLGIFEVREFQPLFVLVDQTRATALRRC